MECISNCVKVVIAKDIYQREYVVTNDENILMSINDINNIHDLDRIMSFPTPDKAKEWIYDHYEILQNSINKYDDRIYVHFYVDKLLINIRFEPQYLGNLDKPVIMLNNNDELAGLSRSLDKVVKLADEFDKKLWEANNDNP